MYKGNVAVCTEKFEGAKFLSSIYRLTKDHSKISFKSKSGESRAYHNNTDTHDNPIFTVVMLVNIMFGED
jgi:mitochondrial fission protein ELM1